MEFKKYIILICLFFSINSCDDYLDIVPDDVATIDSMFNTKLKTLSYLHGCYSYLPKISGRTFMRNGYSSMASGEIWPVALYSNTPANFVAKGDKENTSLPLIDLWSGEGQYYEAARYTSFFLKNVDSVEELEPYEKKMWRGEAHFLMAYYHFLLTRIYGPIILNENFDEVQQAKDTKLPRSDIDEVFAYIIKEVDLAIENLDSKLMNPIKELGRITKPIALAIKARMLVFYASPFFNGNTFYTNFTDKTGKQLIPTTYDIKKWEEAAKACKIAIEAAEANGNRLYNTTDVRLPLLSDKSKLKVALRGRITENWNTEIIWASTASADHQEIQKASIPKPFKQSYSNVIESNFAVPLSIVEMYYSKNGVPIDEDNTYDYNNRYNLKKATSQDKDYIKPLEETAILNFDRESRFYADLAFDRSALLGGRKRTSDDPYYIEARLGEFAGREDNRYYSATGYWPKKLASIYFSVSGFSYSTEEYDFPIIRLADLYLYYAEALNEMKAAPDAEVYKYIDLIRARAGLEGVVDSWRKYSNNPNKPLTKDGMREIIQRERLIEKTFENDRYWDLKRWKLAKEYLNGHVEGWNIEENKSEKYYVKNRIYIQKFGDKNYLSPINGEQVSINNKLVQNPGW